MIISFNGDEGSGKSTTAQKIADELKFPRYYMGQIFRDIAKSKGMTIVEYVKTGEQDSNVDREVDDYMLKISQEQDNFVIEGRTAFHIIPHSIKIYLKVDEKEGAKRIFKQLQEEAGNSRNEIKKFESLEDIIKNVRQRRETDDLRYKKYYGINIRDPKNYDLFLDTTKLTREEVFDHVITFIKKRLG